MSKRIEKIQKKRKESWALAKFVWAEKGVNLDR